MDFDFCQSGMKSSNAKGEGPVQKRTRIMTNSIGLATRLLKSQCARDHEHVMLTNFRAGPCQEYPIPFCDEVCMAIKEEFQDEYAGSSCEVTITLLQMVIEPGKKTHPHDDLENYYQLYHGMDFYDDVRGKPLDKDRAIRARKLDMSSRK